MKVSLGCASRNTIFPAHILLDHDLRVIDTGRLVARQFPDLVAGSFIHEHFRVTSSGEDVALALLVESGALLELESKDERAGFFGWVLPCESGYFLVLRLGLEDYSLDNSALQISDFAPRDPTVHGLLMFTLQRALLDEQRQVTCELVDAQRKSYELLERFSRISGYLAHDFNNFLSIIRLNCDRLSIELTEQPRLARLVEIITAAAARGSAVTQSLMSLSQQRDETRIPVLIDELIEENWAFFATAVGSRVNIELDLNADGARALVSRVALLNSLINLLINARDAMPDGGKVAIRTRTQDKACEATMPNSVEARPVITIEVIDTGEGMSEEVQAQAFDPLFSTKAHGNGFGLPSVRDFISEMGGCAKIRSTPGVGTSVCLCLPSLDQIETGESPVSAMLSQQPKALAEPEHSHRVLVVEDEPYALEALCELLAGHGFEVTGCTSSAEAMAELENNPYCVLLTDIILPGESGAELARAARKRDPALKVILMSGYVPQGEDLDEDWMFVRKPIDARLVTELLRVATRGTD